MGKRATFLLVFFSMLVVSVAAFAHHSAAGLFSPDVTKTIHGTVKEWLFVNPHPGLVLDVKNDAGVVETWRIQFVAPNALAKLGMDRHTFKPGDQVAVFGYPFTGGRLAMFPDKVTLSDGKVYDVHKDLTK